MARGLTATRGLAACKRVAIHISKACNLWLVLGQNMRGLSRKTCTVHALHVFAAIGLLILGNRAFRTGLIPPALARDDRRESKDERS